MQRRQYQPYISRLNTFESPRSAYNQSNRQSLPPQQTSTIKQLIQINNPIHYSNRSNNRNYVIKYPVGEQMQLNEHKCNCDENEYDEINSFNEEDNYSEYDHLNLTAEDHHYLQPAYQQQQQQMNSSSKKDDPYQNNYFHLDRKNLNKQQQPPPPLPKSKLPIIQTKSYNELLNKSLTSSSSFDQFLSPISSGYNSCQDILNYTKQKANDYYYYENNLSSSRYPFMDSGFSTLSSSNRLSSEEDEEASSNLSPYYSSPSSSSSFTSYNKVSTNEQDNEQINMIQASPFPRVNTSLIAQIKQINSNKKLSPIQTKTAKQQQYKSQEPIYENLNKKHLLVSTNKTPKQYSLNDVFNSLKSLDLNNTNHNNNNRKQNISSNKTINSKLIDYTDKLCDKEVEFYLSPPNSQQYNEYHQHIKSNQLFYQKAKTNQFWEQLV